LAEAQTATLERRRQLLAEVNRIREERTATLREERSVDLYAETELSVPHIATGNLAGGDTDWMLDEDDEDEPGVARTMAAAAAVWYRQVPDFVKADREEFAMQAQGAARHYASAHISHLDSAMDTFLRRVAFLNRTATDDEVKSYDPNCVKCRYSRPGATTTHKDHVQDEKTASVALGTRLSWNPFLAADLKEQDEDTPPLDWSAEAPNTNHVNEVDHEVEATDPADVPYDVPFDNFGAPVHPLNAPAVAEEGERVPMPGLGEAVSRKTAAGAARIIADTPNAFGNGTIFPAGTVVTVEGFDQLNPGHTIVYTDGMRGSVPDDAIEYGGYQDDGEFHVGSKTAATWVPTRTGADPEGEWRLDDLQHTATVWSEFDSENTWHWEVIDAQGWGTRDPNLWNGTRGGASMQGVASSKEDAQAAAERALEQMKLDTYGDQSQSFASKTAADDGLYQHTTCKWCGKDCGTWDALQYHINGEHPLAGSGKPGDPALASRTAADGNTCSVCGDSITRDPEGEDNRTWHHTNGTSHDHEAKPSGGDKESARTAAKVAGDVPPEFLEQQKKKGDGDEDDEDADKKPWEKDSARTAGVYCKDHDVWVGDGNADTHAGCSKEQRATDKTKDASRNTASSAKTATDGDENTEEGKVEGEVETREPDNSTMFPWNLPAEGADTPQGAADTAGETPPYEKSSGRTAADDYALECYSCGKKGTNDDFGYGNNRKCPSCGSSEVHSPDAHDNWKSSATVGDRQALAAFRARVAANTRGRHPFGRTAADGSIDNVSGLSGPLKSIFGNEDWYDEWGATMSCLWAIAEAMAAKGGRAPVDHDFGAGGAPTEDEIMDDPDGEHTLAADVLSALNSGEVSMADLDAATRALDAHADQLKAAGKDY
jgi:hypothetical protein